ncbi:hypothetical protein HPB48_009820 [Haemaphysalis longicornis]|uniref:ABC transporter domain-containing protein n=1 Tax=Haemaphysalis longicornis TaxID=44386 RepID=A0A9J6FQT4_HAELO|nr:hypothetical protein HPB48_009820 [Haemaphysalis longicornis]
MLEAAVLTEPCTACAQAEYWLGKRSKVLEVSSPELPKAEVEELPEGLTVVVEAERVYKDYSRIKAVHNVSLKALDNQITAILGLTGAGKTTLIRLFAGIVAPTTGRVTVCGQDTVLGRAFIRTVASFCPRKAVFSADLTVWEHLMLFAAIKGVSLREMSTRAKEVLAELEFHEKLHSFPHLLTENAKKRLLLAIALLSRPRVLFLDEPTELLDEEERREVWDLLGNMRDRCAIILTTSLTEEADMLGDRVAIMSHGRLRCCGTPTFLKKSHGTGYEIRFPNNDDVRAIEQDLLAIVRGRTAQARILHTPRDVIISLGIKDTRGFPDMFKRLEDTCRQHGIKGMRVTVSTLEDVFLKYAFGRECAYSIIPVTLDGQVTTAASISAFCPEISAKEAIGLAMTHILSLLPTANADTALLLNGPVGMLP